jgi:hypothetical protein
LLGRKAEAWAMSFRVDGDVGSTPRPVDGGAGTASAEGSGGAIGHGGSEPG